MYKESQSHGLNVLDLPIVIRNLSQQTVSRRISLTKFRREGFMQVLFPTRCFCHQSTVTCVERCCADPPWLVFFFFIHEPRFDDIILSANSPSKENHFENFPYLFKGVILTSELHWIVVRITLHILPACVLYNIGVRLSEIALYDDIHKLWGVFGRA